MRVLLVVCLVVTSCAAMPEWTNGGGKEYSGAGYAKHGEKADKGYDAFHEQSKGAKGHHDSDHHKSSYGDAGGSKSAHSDTTGYHSSHAGGEKSSKGAHFLDQGHYAKGHSTKGQHSVHTLDEYKKNTDFYSEDHDEAFKESEGGSGGKYSFAKGGYGKGGQFKKVYLEGDYGRKGSFDKGRYSKEDAGHKNAEGKDSYYANGEKFGHNGGTGGFKLWGQNHGHGGY